jgi:DNA-binding CsgD family transcriptional regulator
MRARIHLKKREYTDAAELMRRARFSGAAREQQSQRELILAIAETRAGGFDAADEHFERAAKYDPSLKETGELAYWVGRRHCEAREPREARVYLEELRAIAGTQARIWSDTLESMILSHEERYIEAASLLHSQIEYIDSLDSPHVEDAIWALHTLAGLARELDSPPIRRFVEVRVGLQHWNDDDFLVNHFQAVKAAAWCHALEGDYFNALRMLKGIRSLRVSKPWQAMVSLDRAYLARCFGEKRFAREELADAQDLLDSVSWRSTEDEERVALLLAAELFAEIDSAQAARYLAKFTELRDSINPQLHVRYDRRLQAQADYATGVVQNQLGNRQAAIAALRRSWNVYHAIGYSWRAGRCALRLFELTSDVTWREQAEEKLRHYSNSWLHDDLRASSVQPANLPKLTHAQRQILDLIIDGKSNREISESTGRSIFTIQNHVNAILRAFEVPNRSALLSEAIRRGIAKPPQELPRKLR